MAKISNLGQYGQMKLTYMKQNQPAMLKELKQSGELASYLHKLEDRVNEQIETMISQGLQPAEAREIAILENITTMAEPLPEEERDRIHPDTEANFKFFTEIRRATQEVYDTFCS